VGEGVSIADDVEIGGHVVIHSGTEIGAGAVLQDGAVLGKLPVLGSRTKTRGMAEPAGLVVEAGAQIGCYAVLCAGARVGVGTVVGDHALIREGVVIGADTVIGKHASIQAGVPIGNRVKLGTGVHVGIRCAIEDDVTGTANLVMTEEPGGGPGSIMRRGARCGVNVTLMPSVEVGENAFVGARSLVTRSVPAGMLAHGSPARVIRPVDESLPWAR
jgi:acetyltransferase-like isoleucine patch superfamily enzyme